MKAFGLPSISERTFYRTAKQCVWPCVKDAYFAQIGNYNRIMGRNVDISCDAQYDSPGFSAEIGCVSCLDDRTGYIIDFQSVTRQQTGRSKVAVVTCKAIFQVEYPRGWNSMERRSF